MSKQRNRETKIWDDPWFRKLNCEHKLLWEYICDKADDAAVWKEDLDLASFQINGARGLDKKAALEAFNDGKNRITEFKPGYWFIHGFIQFHYGALVTTNNFHVKILGLIKSHGIEGLVSPCSGAKDKDIVKTKGVELEKGAGGFGAFWTAYPKKRSKGQAERAWKALKPNEQLQGQILAALERAKTSAEWRGDGGRFIPHPATWLNAKGWEDQLEISPGSKREPKHDPNCTSCEDGSGYWKAEGKAPVKCGGWR